MQATQEKQVQSPNQEDPLEEKMATCSSILAWKNPWREEPSPRGCKELDMTEHACMHFIITIPVLSEQDLDNACKAPEDA